MNRFTEISQVNRPVRANLNNRIRAFFIQKKNMQQNNNFLNVIHLYSCVASRFGANQYHFFSQKVFHSITFSVPSRSAIIHFFSSRFLRIRISDIHDHMPFIFVLIIRCYFTPHSFKCHRNEMLTRKHRTPIQIIIHQNKSSCVFKSMKITSYSKHRTKQNEKNCASSIKNAYTNRKHQLTRIIGCNCEA